jgi:hypothetical protein
MVRSPPMMRATTYCAGLPIEGERPLSPEERARVLAMRRDWAIRALSRLGLAAVALALGAAVGAQAEGASGRSAQLLVAAAFVVLGLVAPLIAFFQFRAAVATWLRLARDARGGVALRFASGARSVAVLPHSRFALEWDGAPAAPGRPLVVGEAAEVPASAPTYAVEVSTAGAAPGLGVVRRPLSPAEREEIAMHARRLGRIPAVLAGFTAAFLLLSAHVLGDATQARASVPLVAVWGALLAWAWWRFLRARMLSRKLQEDEANGWALRATAGDPAGNEVLAVSGATWTVQGAPAPWRTRGGRAG